MVFEKAYTQNKSTGRSMDLTLQHILILASHAASPDQGLQYLPLLFVFFLLNIDAFCCNGV